MAEQVSSVNIDEHGAVDGGKSDLAAASSSPIDTQTKANIIMPMKKMAKLAKTCQKHHPDKYCASRDVRHKVEYFNSGAFDYKCVNCGAKMLKSEYFGKASKCCHNGQVNLREHYQILQNALQPLLDLCTNKKEYANLFMRNARPYKTEFAFASIHT
uniref:Uncharacterized protein n=1 Tax=Romanomermis culicivorax TaxID=13658 RepID=A0A915KF69_ROMCU